LNNEPPQLEIHESHEAAGVRLRLRGELDFATADAVADRLARLARGHNRVLLDLDGLTFMDASGVRVVVLAQRRLGDRLVVVKGARAAHRILEICGLDDRLRLINAPPPALRSASRRGAVGGRLDQGTLAAAVRQLRDHKRSGLRPRRPSAL
jgi:anti-anti-sigma factor